MKKKDTSKKYLSLFVPKKVKKPKLVDSSIDIGIGYSADTLRKPAKGDYGL